MTGEPKKAFVLMPFRDPFNSYFEPIYKKALEPLEYTVIRSDNIFKPGVIMEDIRKSILEADLVLCEMSGRNPNVFYELGLAHANGKPVVLVSRKEGDIPFDLRHLRVILYDSSQAGWEDRLRDAIKRTAEAVEGTGETSAEGWESSKPGVEFLAGLTQKLEEVLEEMQARLPQPDPRAAWEKAYSYLSSRYGWGYDDLSVRGSLEPYGSITIEREITVTARSLLGKLEQSLNVRPAEQQVQTLTVDNLDVYSRTAGTVVKRGNIYPLNDGWVIEVIFDPPVPPSSTVTFVLREKLPSDTYAIDYSADRLRKDGIKDQWFGWRLDRPTLHFRAQVQFPPGYRPTGHVHRVFFQPLPKDIANARGHADEETRLEKLLSLNGKVDQSGEFYTLNLDVDLPILGLLYMIRWDPLAHA